MVPLRHLHRFVKQFVQNPRTTGAILPSGTYLTAAMLKPIDFTRARSVVELGPGEGSFTRELLRRLSPDAHLTVIEVNQEFCRLLRNIQDSRLTVMNGDARKLSTLVRKTEYVVSGLPLVGFPAAVHRSILEQIKTVTTVAYVQFHYSTLGEKYFNEVLGTTTRMWVPANVPPAFVYVYKVNGKTQTKRPTPAISHS